MTQKIRVAFIAALLAASMVACGTPTEDEPVRHTGPDRWHEFTGPDGEAIKCYGKSPNLGDYKIADDCVVSP